MQYRSPDLQILNSMRTHRLLRKRELSVIWVRDLFTQLSEAAHTRVFAPTSNITNVVQTTVVHSAQHGTQRHAAFYMDMPLEVAGSQTIPCK